MQDLADRRLFPAALDKVRTAAHWRQQHAYGYQISIDGGINAVTAPERFWLVPTSSYLEARFFGLMTGATLLLALGLRNTRRLLASDEFAGV